MRAAAKIPFHVSEMRLGDSFLQFPRCKSFYLQHLGYVVSETNLHVDQFAVSVKFGPWFYGQSTVLPAKRSANGHFASCSGARKASWATLLQLSATHT